MKNLKKGLAVAMSLAMIATVMPTMNVNAAVPACSTTTRDAALDLLYAIKADLGTTKLKDLSIDAETITWTNTLGALKTISGVSDDITLANNKLGTLLAEDGDGSTSILDYITAYVDCDGGNDDAKFLAGVKDDGATTRSILAKVGALDTALNYLNTTFADGSVVYKTDGEYNTAKGHYDTIVALYDTFKGNLTDEAAPKKATKQAYYNDYFADLKDAVEEYEESFIGDFSDDYVAALKTTKILDDMTVNALVNGTGEFLYSNLAKLEKFIADLKEDKVTLKDAEGTAVSVVSYKTVADEADVIDLVEGLEAIVDDLKEVKELLKSTSKTVKDYKSISSATNDKVGDLVTAIEAYDDTDEEKIEDYENALAAFRSGDITKLVNYVEDIVEQFYTIEVVKRTSGNYTLRTQPTEFARYATKTDVVSADLETILTTNIVKDEEESVYDALTDNQSDTDKLMNAITTIEDIRIGTTFTTAEADKIVAAKRAYTAMTNDAGAFVAPYTTTLTAKEKRTVKANADLIEALYFKLMLTGTVTESGWIDLGNGNWDYINADGSKSTKWVAAGTNWYFVQAGHMLRNSWVAQDATGAVWYYVDGAGKMVVNTTIDGYVINANGEWHKK